MVGASLYFLQEKILFRPTILPQEYKFEFSYPFQELFLKTDGEAIINALHFKAENSKGVILYFHGNAGNLSRWGVITEYFVNLNYDVLVMDYRGYGKSTGPLSEEALYNDAQFCFNYLKNEYKEDRITIYGRSLGTGIAAYIASKNSPKQLILETPYYSIADIAKQKFPLVPTKYLLKYKLPTFKFIQKVRCSIAILHGTEDHVIPFKSGEKLFNAAPKHKTTFTIIQQGNHNNLIDFKEYHYQIKDLLP